MDNFSITKPLNEEEYKQLLRQAVALLPWSHNLLLMGYNLSSEHVELVNELKINKKQIETYSINN